MRRVSSRNTTMLKKSGSEPRTIESAWPPIRAWKVTPIKGGWTVGYDEPPLTMTVGGNAPQSVLAHIVNARLANGLPPDAERIKCWLEQQWHRRDPKRFTRPPGEWDEGVIEPVVKENRLEISSWIPGFLAAINAAAAIGEAAVVFAIARAVMAMAKNDAAECRGCDKFIHEFMTKHPSVKGAAQAQDWAWGFQSGLNAVLDRPQKPRKVVEAEWKWK